MSKRDSEPWSMIALLAGFFLVLGAIHVGNSKQADASVPAPEPTNVGASLPQALPPSPPTVEERVSGWPHRDRLTEVARLAADGWEGRNTEASYREADQILATIPESARESGEARRWEREIRARRALATGGTRPGLRRSSAPSPRQHMAVSPPSEAIPWPERIPVPSLASQGWALRPASGYSAFPSSHVAFPGLCAENGSCFGDISPETGRRKIVPVRPYYRRDGTYVPGHYRSPPKPKRRGYLTGFGL